MDLTKLYALLRETTVQLRKGEMFEGDRHLLDQAKEGVEPERGLQGSGVLEVYAMPPVSAAPDLEKVDCEFIVVGVDKAKAEARRDDFVDLLRRYPQPDRLAAGPSYIEVGGVIGDQGAAFCLFALGQVLGLWKVITPAQFGLTGEEARRAAGSGFVMITGWSI